MQEKKDIGSMAEKYKAEMMRIYNSNKPSAVASAPKYQEMQPTEMVTDSSCETCAEQTEKFISPPITAVPYENAAEEVPGCKFPTAEELIKADCDSCGDGNAVEAMSRCSDGNIPDTRFDSERNAEEHMQGNYDQYSDDEEAHGNNDECSCYTSETIGKGYIQAEVTNIEDGSPIAGAVVAVLKQAADSDILVEMLVTDSHGMTETAELPTTVSAEGSKPCSEYMITVMKKGFYSINMLSVPIFDTIKSIQPIEMTQAVNECGKIR